MPQHLQTNQIACLSPKIWIFNKNTFYLKGWCWILLDFCAPLFIYIFGKCIRTMSISMMGIEIIQIFFKKMISVFINLGNVMIFEFCEKNSYNTCEISQNFPKKLIKLCLRFCSSFLIRNSQIYNFGKTYVTLSLSQMIDI